MSKVAPGLVLVAAVTFCLQPDMALGQGATDVLTAPEPIASATETVDFDQAEPDGQTRLGGEAEVSAEPTSPSADSASTERVDEPQLSAELHDYSPLGMFMAADYVVKAVMVGLALASVVTWTIWLAKSLELLGAQARLKRALRVLQSSTSLAEAKQALARRRGAAVNLLNAALQEVERAETVIDYADNGGLKERVGSRLGRIELAVGRRLSAGTGILASVGSVSPFVGLFGTVWGIMNSFINISAAQTSSLAVVAPGIAEALLATAIGLVAAIPAVIFYNAFARSISGYRLLLGDAAAVIERLVSSDLDCRYVARKHQGAVQAVAAE